MVIQYSLFLWIVPFVIFDQFLFHYLCVNAFRCDERVIKRLEKKSLRQKRSTEAITSCLPWQEAKRSDSVLCFRIYNTLRGNLFDISACHAACTWEPHIRQIMKRESRFLKLEKCFATYLCGLPFLFTNSGILWRFASLELKVYTYCDRR